MNEENTHKLFTDFDRLFRGRTEPRTQSNMYEGFDCRDGWFNLLYDLCVQITKYSQKAGIDPKVSQVKVFCGRLYFDVHEWDDTLVKICEEAMNQSVMICDGCGGDGRNVFGKDERFRTTCANCREKSARKNTILKKLPKSTRLPVKKMHRIKFVSLKHI